MLFVLLVERQQTGRAGRQGRAANRGATEAPSGNQCSRSVGCLHGVGFK